MKWYPSWAVRATEYFERGYDKWPKVYFIGTNYDEPIKIGRSVNVSKRKDSLQVGNPGVLQIFATCPEGEIINEMNIHAGYIDARLNGEWFKPVPTLISLIEELKSGKRWKVAERLGKKEIDLDWMATQILAVERGIESRDAMAKWLEELTDDDVSRISKIKAYMPL